MLAAVAWAQEDSVVVKHKKHNENFELPVYHGWSVHLDILSPCMNLINGDIYGAEAQFDVNLYNRVFPILEFGYADATCDVPSGIEYKTKAPYVRLGVNYGLLKPFNKRGNHRSLDCYPFVGVRYGMAFMDYRIDNVVIADRYWGAEQKVNYNQPFEYSGWLELLGGVRINLAKGFTLGWSVRFRTLLHTSASDKTFVWYVPGYGKSDGNAFTFNYTIGYTFSIDKRPKTKDKGSKDKGQRTEDLGSETKDEGQKTE